jgi:hypothetical protein
MKKKNQDRSLTIRLNSDLYQKCINRALKEGAKEGKIIKVSDIVRYFIEEGVK